VGAWEARSLGEGAGAAREVAREGGVEVVRVEGVPGKGGWGWGAAV